MQSKMGSPESEYTKSICSMSRVGNESASSSLRSECKVKYREETTITKGSGNIKREKNCFCIMWRSLVSFVLFGSFLYAIMLVIVSLFWSALFAAMMITLRENLRTTVMKGLTENVNQQNDIIVSYGQSIASVFTDRDNFTRFDLDSSTSLLQSVFRRITMNGDVEGVFLGYRPKPGYLLGFATKGYQFDNYSLAYRWPNVTKDDELVRYPLLQDGDDWVIESEKNETLLFPHDVNVPVDSVTWGQFGLLCVARCQPRFFVRVPIEYPDDSLSFAMVSFDARGYSSLLQNFVSKFDKAFLMDSEGYIVATSMDNFDRENFSKLYHYTDNPFPDNDVQSNLEQMMRRKKVQNMYAGGYVTSRFYVDYQEIELYPGYSMYVTYMTNVSYFIVIPVAGSLFIWFVAICFMVLGLLFAGCGGMSIRKAIKALVYNIDKMKDLKLEEISPYKKGSFFTEIKELQIGFEQMYKQLVEISHFLPDHLVQYSDSSSHSESHHSVESHRVPFTPMSGDELDFVTPVHQFHSESIPSARDSFHSDQATDKKGSDKYKGRKKKTKLNIHLKETRVCILTIRLHEIYEKIEKIGVATFFEEDYRKFFREVKRIANIHRLMFIDKFTSNEVIMAFKKPIHACDCAFQIFRSLRWHNSEKKIKFSIGLAAGPCYNGIIGDTQMKRRHVFGKVVKSSRKLAREAFESYKVQISINESLFSEVKTHFQTRPILKYHVDGVTHQAYELVRRHSLHIQQEWLYLHRERELQKQYDEFTKAYNLFQLQDYEKAKALFEKFELDHPHDYVVCQYLCNCNQRIQKQLDEKNKQFLDDEEEANKIDNLDDLDYEISQLSESMSVK